MSYHPAKFGGHSHSVSGLIMNLFCRVILQDHVMKGSHDLWSLIISHHPAKFGGHRQCRSGDIMFLVANEENPRCSCFNSLSLFISKEHGLKAHGISYY